MTGTRLEINANVVSALAPHLHNLQKSAEMAKVDAHTVLPAVLAAARAVLKESQMENGVAVIDVGGATTSIAVFEEGDLQYVGVIPVGGVNITNDLAIGLKVDPEIAEIVKLAHASAMVRGDGAGVTVKHEKDTFNFTTEDIDEIVGARLEELFDSVNKELKKAGRAGRLPSGVVLTGGTSNLKNIAEYAKAQLGVAARIGKSEGYGGVSDDAEKPEFATAIGLMLVDSEGHRPAQKSGTTRSVFSSTSAKQGVKKASGFVSKFIDKFKV